MNNGKRILRYFYVRLAELGLQLIGKEYQWVISANELHVAFSIFIVFIFVFFSTCRKYETL